MATETTTTKSSKLWKIISFVAVPLAVLAIIGVFLLHSKSKKVKEKYATEQQKVQEQTEEIDGLNDQIILLDGENKELDRSLEDAFKGMAAKDIVIERLNKENATLLQIKNELKEVQQISVNLSSSNDQLKKMQQKINRIIELKRSDNLKLKEKLK